MRLDPRLVEGTGGEAKQWIDGKLTRTYQTGLFIESNNDDNCLSLRYIDEDGEDEDLIHICDWPALRAAIDQYQRERGGHV